MKLLLLLLLWSPQTSAWLGFFEKAQVAPHLSCKDGKNNDVPWYILYKAPNSQDYLYIDETKEDTLQHIGGTDGVLANTLRPVFSQMPDSFGFLFYNDQPPGKPATSPSHGHSKGVLLGDSKTGTALWITHSTPNFPFPKQLKGFFPSSGNRNAQTFMCVTLTDFMVHLQLVGVHLQNINAYVFGSNLPQGFPEAIRKAEGRKAENRGQAPQTALWQSLKVGNKEFRTVAKSMGKSADDGDLYVQLSRGFRSDMDAQTWGCQQNKDKSYCEGQYKYKVMTVEKVCLVKNMKWEWPSTRDHSKWAVTTGNNVDWTCIADMNRAVSQYQRPGGALCIQDKRVSDIFKKFIHETLQCRKRPRECVEEMDTLSDDLEELHLNKHDGF